jgi:nitroreductase
MKFESPVIALIKKRRSARTYINKDFDAGLLEKINAILQSHAAGPFGNDIRFSLIKKDFAKENHKVKIGTYGFISGACYFIAGEVKNLEHANEDYGYLLETIILHLTALDLGTCWLGGTFSRSDFSEILKSDSGTVIPAITPVGYPADHATVRESIIRWGAGSDRRKHWEDLFFADAFAGPLSKADAAAYEVPLEMVRLAPSASNKQPWRITKTDDAFHFYLKRTKGYNRIGKGVDLQLIDMGIAMSHFELACRELNLNGQWIKNDPGIVSPEIDSYCISWALI